jgi:hypothetical protein
MSSKDNRTTLAKRSRKASIHDCLPLRMDCIIIIQTNPFNALDWASQPGHSSPNELVLVKGIVD